MGLASGRSAKPSRAAPRRDRAKVVDTIEMKESLGISHAPGIVTVLDDFQMARPEILIGRRVMICRPDGSELVATIEAVRDHLRTMSLFFRGLTTAEIPLGSSIDLAGFGPLADVEES